MKELLKNVNLVLKPLGYKKKGNNFWKIEDEIYKIINFQRGEYGDYFFINLGIHPIGLPEVYPEKIIIPEYPKHYQCIIDQRVGRITTDPEFDVFREAMVYFEDKIIVEKVMKILPVIEEWFKKHGTLKAMAKISEEECFKLLSRVPIIRRKALYLLKLYCYIKLSDKENAKTYFIKYKNESVKDYNYDLLDAYLLSLIGEIDNQKVEIEPVC